MKTKIISILLICFLFPSCNMFSSFDSPDSEYETASKARALMDDKKCAEAVKLYDGKSGLDNDSLITLGTAQLCATGVTMTSIGKTVFAYSTSGSTGLKIIGNLANAILPQSAAGVTNVSNAISNFNLITDSNTRNLYLAIGYVVKVATILAASAGNDGNTGAMIRADIDPTCSSTCANACGQVTGGSVSMSAADLVLIKTTIISLASVAGALGSALGTVNDLATALNSSFANLAGAAAIGGFASCQFLSL